MKSAASSPDLHQFAYLILAHGRQQQLMRLIRTLRAGSPKAAILLHYDAKAKLPDRRVLDAFDVGLVEPRIAVTWGDVSQLDALLSGLAYAIKHYPFRWLSVISGQDYPLRPLSLIESELADSSYDAFVKAAPVGTYKGRYHSRFWLLPRFHYWHRVPKSLRNLFRWLRVQMNKHQPFLRIEGGGRGTPLRLGVYWLLHPFESGAFECYKGSDWFTLSRLAAEHILQFGDNEPEILTHYRRTYMPSESYFQTVLCNAKELRVRDDHRRFITWDDARLSHPITLTIDHLAAMENSGKDFGRKFDELTDSEILDVLDRKVLGSSNARVSRGGENAVQT